MIVDDPSPRSIRHFPTVHCYYLPNQTLILQRMRNSPWMAVVDAGRRALAVQGRARAGGETRMAKDSKDARGLKDAQECQT